MFCISCGKEVPVEAKFCPACGAAVTREVDVPASESKPELQPVSKPAQEMPVIPQQVQTEKLKKLQMIFWIFFAVAFVIALTILALMPKSLPSRVTSSNPTPTPLSRDEYIALCTVPDYKTVARSPDDYVGEYFKISGKVIQVLEDSDTITLRVNQDSDYKQTWIVAGKLPSSNRILDGDTVTVYGTYYGTYTYETVLGGKNTLPALTMRYYSVKS